MTGSRQASYAFECLNSSNRKESSGKVMDRALELNFQRKLAEPPFVVIAARR